MKCMEIFLTQNVYFQLFPKVVKSEIDPFRPNP